MIFILSTFLDLKPLDFFKLFSLVSAFVGTVMMILSCIYLMIIKPRQLRHKGEIGSEKMNETGAVDLAEDGFAWVMGMEDEKSMSTFDHPTDDSTFAGSPGSNLQRLTCVT